MEFTEQELYAILKGLTLSTNHDLVYQLSRVEMLELQQKLSAYIMETA